MQVTEQMLIAAAAAAEAEGLLPAGDGYNQRHRLKRLIEAALRAVEEPTVVRTLSDPPAYE